tara:strand:- start:3142 stop:4686 length:1545 start_codon:yes stop_codon:yes gene_type:complete
MIIPYLSIGQSNDFVCAYESEENPSFNQSSDAFSHSIDPAVLYAKDPKVLNVFFWQVNQFNGQFGDDPNQDIDITEEEVLSAIANLNIEFNPYNIFFKYRGLDQFNSPETVYFQEKDEAGFCYDIYPIEIDENGFNTIDGLCQSKQLFAFASDNDYMTAENVNIFIPYNTVGFRAGGQSNEAKMIIKRGDFDNKVMIHEMGHVLYLNHTHEGHRDLNDPTDDDNNYTSCEHVTRDTSNPDYNAEGSADYTIDTAAVPEFYREHYYELLDLGLDPSNFEAHKYIEDCLYTGDGKDCLDVPYEIFPSDAKNVMSYTKNECRDTFTIGQAIRMHEILELWPQNYGPKLTELSELFEPYKGEYYVAGPLPDHYQAPLFQPGFEYKFIECSGDFAVPSDYGTYFSYDINTVLLQIDNDETNYPSISHPNHSAIFIKHDYGDFLNNPNKCYNNYNRKPSGGTIIRFNDNVLNTNVTITAQDSTAINDENFINNLEPGLYNIIEQYEDGDTIEKVIIKENN